MANHETDWNMNSAQKITTLTTLSCLIAIYMTVVFYGSLNSY